MVPPQYAIVTSHFYIFKFGSNIDFYIYIVQVSEKMIYYVKKIV